MPRRAPSLGSMFDFSAGSGNANWKPPSHYALGPFEWAGCLVPWDVLPPFHNIVARTKRCVQRTLLFGPYFLTTYLTPPPPLGGERQLGI